MSFVPSTTVKNGITLKLSNVNWQVQSTDLVDDVLVPASYVAVATYTGTAWYQAATGYITTADYVGTVTSAGVRSITYTLTYTGTPIPGESPIPKEVPKEEQTQNPEPLPSEAEALTAAREFPSEQENLPVWVWITGGALALLALTSCVVLIIVLRKRGTHEGRYYETEDMNYEERN